MVIRITTHRANSLSNKTLSRLLELTIDASRGDYVDDGDRNFTVESVLADILSERIAGLKPFNKKAHIVCARIGAKIVGWALIGPAWLINRTGVMLYIDPEHRRHGLGNKLSMPRKRLQDQSLKVIDSLLHRGMHLRVHSLQGTALFQIEICCQTSCHLQCNNCPT